MKVNAFFPYDFRTYKRQIWRTNRKLIDALWYFSQEQDSLNNIIIQITVKHPSRGNIK